ncbi:MAG: thioredoxin [Flavobacteriales bacterium]|nr:thioredoxin [Flavobacteriales bacterium]
MAQEITDSNFEQIISAGIPAVVDFWAPWCGPCRMVGPIVEELATEYQGKVNIGKVNVDDNPGISAAQSIRNIPTILFFKDGKLVDKQVGVASKADLKAKIEALLK